MNTRRQFLPILMTVVLVGVLLVTDEQYFANHRPLNDFKRHVDSTRLNLLFDPNVVEFSRAKQPSQILLN